MARNQFEDEFTVHVISSASMQIFKSNTLASFRNFFNDEIQISGDWRVALSEIIFPTKIENVVEGNSLLSAFSIGRVALPLARRFILPTAKRIGKELLKQSVPELLDVVSSKKSPKQALKNTITNTVKKQTGGSRKKTLRQRRLRSRSKSSSKKSAAVTKRRNIFATRRPLKRSRSDFFANVNDDR